jgi:hypothetical protein
MGRHAKPEYEVKKSSVPNGRLYWYIIGRPNGVKKRAWFPTRAKAQAEATERNIKLRRLGQDSAKVDNSLIVMAVEGATELSPFGKTIRDAVQFFKAHLKQASNSASVAELCKIVRAEFAFRLANEGATLRHKRTMDSELKKFEARFGDRPIKTLNGNEIKDWLTGLDLASKTRMKIFGYIRNAYGIAVQKGLLEMHPFEKVENFMRSKKSEAPAFPLTPEEATKSAALEAAGSGVRVNVVAPGPIETGMLNRFTGTNERKAGLVGGVPLKRTGRPEEIAQTIVFLSSDNLSSRVRPSPSTAAKRPNNKGKTAQHDEH